MRSRLSLLGEALCHLWQQAWWGACGILVRGTLRYAHRSPRLTSAQWQAVFPEVQVHDPDGWDRRVSHWIYSWHVERIDFNEYRARVLKSTCMWPVGDSTGIFTTYRQ